MELQKRNWWLIYPPQMDCPIQHWSPVLLTRFHNVLCPNPTSHFSLLRSLHATLVTRIMWYESTRRINKWKMLTITLTQFIYYLLFWVGIPWQENLIIDSKMARSSDVTSMCHVLFTTFSSISIQRVSSTRCSFEIKLFHSYFSARLLAFCRCCSTSYMEYKPSCMPSNLKVLLRHHEIRAAVEVGSMNLLRQFIECEMCSELVLEQWLSSNNPQRSLRMQSFECNRWFERFFPSRWGDYHRLM